MKKKKLLKYAIRIHLYAGLFASIFLILAGFTAINFQHDLLSTEPRDTVHFSQDISITDLPAKELSHDIARQLNISGHTPNWDYRFDKNDNLIKFKIHRPARLYEVELFHETNQANVAEIRYQSGAILEIMHKTTMIDLPDGPLVGWAIFGQIAAVSAFMAILVSLYFWWSKSVAHYWQWMAAALSSFLILIYVLYLWQVG